MKKIFYQMSSKITIKKIAIVLYLFMACMPSVAWAKSQVMVCAAASLADALDDVAHHFEQREDVNVITHYAGSNTIALQIRQGAPCDLFIAAHPFYTNTLIEEGRAMHVHHLLSNQLVMITSQADSSINGIKDLLSADGDIALADPEVVPAGIYAKDVLKHHAMWDAVRKRIIPAADVRAAMTMVMHKTVAWGIVYHSDALTQPDIRIAYHIPRDSHTPIMYPMVIMATSSKRPEVKRFYQMLRTAEALTIFKEYGFDINE